MIRSQLPHAGYFTDSYSLRAAVKVRQREMEGVGPTKRVQEGDNAAANCEAKSPAPTEEVNHTNKHDRWLPRSTRVAGGAPFSPPLISHGRVVFKTKNFFSFSFPFSSFPPPSFPLLLPLELPCHAYRCRRTYPIQLLPLVSQIHPQRRLQIQLRLPLPLQLQLPLASSSSTMH